MGVIEMANENPRETGVGRVALWPSLLISCGVFVVFWVIQQEMTSILRDSRLQTLNEKAQFALSIVRGELNDRINAHSRLAGRWHPRSSLSSIRWTIDAKNYLAHQKGLKALCIVDAVGTVTALQKSSRLSNAYSTLAMIFKNDKTTLESWNFTEQDVLISLPPQSILPKFQALILYTPIEPTVGTKGYMMQLIDFNTLCRETLRFLDEHEISISEKNHVLYESSSLFRSEISSVPHGNANFSLRNLDVSGKLISDPHRSDNLGKEYPTWFMMAGIAIAVSFGFISYFHRRSKSQVLSLNHEIAKRKKIERNQLATSNTLRKVNQELIDQKIAALHMAQEAESAREAATENQRFLDTVFEHLPVMVFVKDAANLRYIKFNRAGELLTGYSEEDLIGKSERELFADDQATLLVQNDRQTLMGGATVEIPNESILTRVKEKRILRTIKVPINDPSGNPQYLLGISEDITDRIASEERIKQLTERLKLATMAAKIGIWDWDVERNTLIWDERMFQLYNVGEDQFPGAYEAWKRLLHPDDAERAEQDLAMALEGDADYDSEFRIVDSTGSVRYIKAYGYVQRNSKNKPKRAVGINFDISSIRQAEQRFRQLIEAAPSGMIMVDQAGSICLANARAHEMFGYANAELHGQSIESLAPDRFRKYLSEYRQKFFASPRTRAMGAGRDLYGLRKNTSEFPVEIGLNPVETNEGRFILSSVVDITERKRREKGLKDYARTLEEINAELDQFTYIASHDLQEPLRNLISYSALLKEDLGSNFEDNVEEDLHFITDAARRMNKLVEDLLTLSHTRRSDMKHVKVSLNECVGDALESLRSVVDQSMAVIQCDTLPEVIGDPTYLTMLFQNLLGNSLKFIKDRSPEIQITAQKKGRNWIVGIKDNGIGIKEDHLERIFSPFKRLHGKNEYGGTGIGLAICRKAVERHGGHIWVESEFGKGSQFWILLPQIKGDKCPSTQRNAQYSRT